MYIGRELYDRIDDPALQREVFRKSINRVEIETHSYCNRRCDYCPNVTGDRLGPNVPMAEAVWRRIVSDLAEVSYSGAMVLTSYNEPLYDRELILRRLAEAHRALPAARRRTSWADSPTRCIKTASPLRCSSSSTPPRCGADSRPSSAGKFALKHKKTQFGGCLRAGGSPFLRFSDKKRLGSLDFRLNCAAFFRKCACGFPRRVVSFYTQFSNI